MEGKVIAREKKKKKNLDCELEATERENGAKKGKRKKSSEQKL